MSRRSKAVLRLCFSLGLGELTRQSLRGMEKKAGFGAAADSDGVGVVCFLRSACFSSVCFINVKAKHLHSIKRKAKNDI